MTTATTSPVDPLHSRPSPDAHFSTANTGEACPGVLTPLAWTLWGPASERCVRRTFHGFGVLAADETDVPTSEEDRIFGIFYGRIAMRADFMCRMGDRLPGTDGTKVAEQILAVVPPDFESHPTARYYPRVAVKMPRFMLSRPRLVRVARAETEALYRPELARIATAGLEEAHGRFREAAARFDDNVDKHGSAVIAVVQPIYDQLSKLLTLVEGVGAEIMGGYGDHEESKMVEDLWACSRGRMDLDALLGRHGYHGPREGELSSVVWREDPTPLERILDGYRALGDDADPVQAQAERAKQREQAEARLLAGIKGPKRAQARAVLAAARRYVPLRGVGKVAFLQSLDLVRAAARRLGTLLADKGVFDDPGDIFFLTLDEVCSGQWDAGAEQVSFRRERHSTYQKLTIPAEWKGMPTAVPLDEAETSDSLLVEGIGASAGVAEGRVRVITDPGETAMEPGEILVAHMTDPSWASVLFLCSALVIDIGGVLSHAPVVARELGVPCVVNTKVGTKLLRTGDLCRVDGSTGRVEVLERAAS